VKIKLQPFLFSRADLQAIAGAIVLCADGNARLVQLIQQIHRFRDGMQLICCPLKLIILGG
jgi:hypothetical protein